jgi:ADP-heptose:LPS heptosyltransferase
MPESIKHILVIRFSALGDVAMSVPVLRAFVSQHPNIKLTVLTKSFLAPIFENIDNVQVYSVDLKEKHKGIKGLYRLSKEIKQLNADAIADLHNVLRTKILKVFLSALPFVQIDKGRKEKKALVSGKNFEQLKTTHQRYADVFERLGFEINLSQPTFPQKLTLNSDLNIYFQTQNIVIGIAPFAAHIGKMYPLEQMKHVISDLSKRYKVLLFGGGKQEINALGKIASSHDNVFNLAGKLNLKDELSIISNLDLMLSMDSGNGHLAANFGVEVVSIWGVTHPYLGFYPFNQQSDNALLADRNKFPKIPTSVYGNKYPEGYEMAIESIAPNDIINKVEEILKKSPTLL